MATMGEVKRAHASAGGHFFDPATMRFFKSRVVSARLHDGGFFITSEQYEDEPRHYRVRRFDAADPIDIETVGDPLGSLDDARALIRGMQGK